MCGHKPIDESDTSLQGTVKNSYQRLNMLKIHHLHPISHNSNHNNFTGSSQTPMMIEVLTVLVQTVAPLNKVIIAKNLLFFNCICLIVKRKSRICK